MATYTDPATINTDPKDPITSEFGTAALDNPVAIAEGASGAPRVAGEAIATPSDVDVLTIAAADTYEVSAVLPSNTLGASEIFSKDFVCYTGSVRFTITHGTGTGTGVTSILVNGVVVATDSWNSRSETFSKDITFSAGDTISVTIGGSYPAQVNSVTADDGYEFVTPIRRASTA